MSDYSYNSNEDAAKLADISQENRTEEHTLGKEQYFYCDGSSTSNSPSILGSDVDLIQMKTDIGPNYLEDTRLGARIKPFNLVHTFGVNPKAGIRNLTTESKCEIFFSSSNVIIIYDYFSKAMRILEGHQGTVVSITANYVCNCIATCDEAEENSSIIIWDTKSGKPIFTLFDLYPKSGAILLNMSGHSKYLIALGFDGECYSLDFWLWMDNGSQTPEDSYKIKNCYGLPQKILINQNVEEHLMVIFEKQVFFINWDIMNNKLVEAATPVIPNSSRIGMLNVGSYVAKCHECFVASSRGCLLIFGNTLYSRPFTNEAENDNAKIFKNVIKVSNAAITAMKSIDGLFAVGTADGHVYFFDKRVRLMYWYTNFNMGVIRSISFELFTKNFRYVTKQEPRKHRQQEDVFKYVFLDMTQEIEATISAESLPTDATLQRKPFLVRNFLVLTWDCNIYLIDNLKNTCTSLFHVADADVAAIETHFGQPYLLIAFANGRITLFDYEKNHVISTTILPNIEDANLISCIKYCNRSFHLICGTTTGYIWILEPIFLKPKRSEPFMCEKHRIMKIVFSYDSQQFAYYDDNKMVFLFNYDSEDDKWVHIGKVRSHFKDINDILFFPEANKSVLATIGKDRHIVEYNNLDYKLEFGIKLRERIEQSALPMCFTCITRSIKGSDVGYYLIADNQHKFKLVPVQTKMTRSVVLAPSFGCFKHQQIRKMQILENNDKYMLFITKKHMGIQMLPPDGNPYKYVGYLCHPKELLDFVISADNKFIFTFGADDRCVLMWEIKTKSVDILNVLGGKELDPYYCLIEGGRNGFVFQEMIDLFYYIQILEQGVNISLPRVVTDTIPISELPDLFRACGYYPSEFEIENLIVDIKYRNYDVTEDISDEVNFSEFLKLFLNHRPAYGYSLKRLETAFNSVLEHITDDDSIPRDDFVDILTSAGDNCLSLQGFAGIRRELLNINNLWKCFKILLRAKDDKSISVPDQINYTVFIEELLGIVMNADRINVTTTVSEVSLTTDSDSKIDASSLK